MRPIYKLVLLLSMIVTLSEAACENKLFSFSVADSSKAHITIKNILDNIAESCSMSIIYEDEQAKEKTSKAVSNLNIKNYTLEELLHLLLNDNNLFYTLQNNILKISYLKTKSFYIDYVSFTTRKSTTNKVIKTGSGNSDSGSDSTTMDFTSEFKFWSKIQNEINSILQRESEAGKTPMSPLVNQDAGIITVTGTLKQLNAVEKYLKIISKRMHKQILIEAKIIEVQFNKNRTTGINWSQFQLSLNGSSDALRSRSNDILTNTLKKPNYLIGYNFTMSGLINFLKTQGDVKVVSSPKIMTLNNQPAVINVGTEVNYRYDSGSTTTTSSGGTTTTPNYETDSTFVGVTLDITPQVTKDNYIILKINPVVSDIADRHVDANGVPFLAPDIKIKQLSSLVMVKDNSKILIGGLISKQDGITDTSVPLLSSIPIIGNAFKSSAKDIQESELIIVIVPHIVNNSTTPTLKKYEQDKRFKDELK